MAIELSVNLDKIALIRNSRDGDSLRLIDFATSALRHGADGVTVHPRPDRRHILAEDVYDLSQLPDINLNVEGNPFAAATSGYPRYIDIVKQTRPQQCTLVPDSDEQKTSDHGWNLAETADQLRPIIKQLKSFGCKVSLFIDPIGVDYSIAKDIGADRLELYTESFAKAYNSSSWDEVRDIFFRAADKIHAAGLELNAGHDLNLENIVEIKKLPHLKEVSIGHALIIDALRLGWEETIKNYKSLLNS